MAVKLGWCQILRGTRNIKKILFVVNCYNEQNEKHKNIKELAASHKVNIHVTKE